MGTFWCRQNDIKIVILVMLVAVVSAYHRHMMLSCTYKFSWRNYIIP